VDLDAGQLRTAGREAVERRDWDAAFELLGALESPDAGDIELRADAALWSRHYGDVLGLFERAADAYLRAGDRVGSARMYLKLSLEHAQRGEFAVAHGCGRRAATLLAELPESDEHARAACLLARAALFEGDIDLLLERADEAAAIARRVGSAEAEALAGLYRGHALLGLGRYEEGRALMDEANAAATSGALSLEAAGHIYCSTIFSCRNLGDWRRAAEWTDVSLRWCERQHVSGFPGLCRFHRAEVLRMGGRLDDAEVDARHAIAELIAVRPVNAGWGYMELGEIRRRRGDLEGAQEAFQTSTQLGTDPQPGYALLRLAQGDRAAARAMIERSIASRAVDARQERVITLPAAITIAIANGDLELATRHLDELRAVAERSGTPHGRAAMLSAVGALALARGHAADAIEPLCAAWEIWCEADAPYEAAAARVLLGKAHRSNGNEATARLELAAALSTFEALGARRDVDDVSALLVAPPSAATPDRVHTTLVFIDMVRSTPLVEALGDDAWAELLSWYERTLRTVFDEHGGTAVNQEGDGFFVTFAEPAAALDCAVEIQRVLAAHRHDHGFAPRVRIGLHTADAHRRGDDYSGLGVHAAARIAATAAADEIIASVVTIDADRGDRFTSNRRAVSLKGLSDPVEVATVTWK
jgi:class 3 adenylate cyclase